MAAVYVETDPKLSIHAERLHKQPLVPLVSVPAFTDIAKPANDVSPLMMGHLFAKCGALMVW